VVVFSTVAIIVFMAIPLISTRLIRQRIRFNDISCRP
jgi:hypothetical protein